MKDSYLNIFNLGEDQNFLEKIGYIHSASVMNSRTGVPYILITFLDANSMPISGFLFNKEVVERGIENSIQPYVGKLCRITFITRIADGTSLTIRKIEPCEENVQDYFNISNTGSASVEAVFLKVKEALNFLKLNDISEDIFSKDTINSIMNKISAESGYVLGGHADMINYVISQSANVFDKERDKHMFNLAISIFLTQSQLAEEGSTLNINTSRAETLAICVKLINKATASINLSDTLSNIYYTEMIQLIESIIYKTDISTVFGLKAINIYKTLKDAFILNSRIKYSPIGSRIILNNKSYINS